MKDHIIGFLKPIALAALAALAPIKAILISVGFLIIFDLFTGIWAASKRGEPIKSAAMRRTVSKMVIYQVAVISGFLVEQYLMNNLIPVAKLVASVIGLVELSSVLENCNSILGKNLFKSIIARLGSENDKLTQEVKKDE